MVGSPRGKFQVVQGGKRVTEEAQKQSYDNVLKRLVENQAAQIIPLLFRNLVLEVVEELNIEVLLPPRRTDRVYRSRDENGHLIILHIEFESKANSKMAKRLLIYHALLWEKYDLPIISIIVYPFEVHMVSSPLKEVNGQQEILSFQYETLPLWQQDAQRCFKAREIPLYGFLPAMQGVSDELLLQAIDQMVEYYEKHEGRLREELLCFQVLLTRAQRLPEIQIERVLRRVRMFDSLLEEDPWVQAKITESKLKGKAEGLAEGKVEGLAVGKVEGELLSTRSIFVTIVKRRFPDLTGIAETKARQIDQPQMLGLLIDQVLQAEDENAVRGLLEQYPAS